MRSTRAIESARMESALAIESARIAESLRVRRLTSPRDSLVMRIRCSEVRVVSWAKLAADTPSDSAARTDARITEDRMCIVRLLNARPASSVSGADGDRGSAPRLPSRTGVGETSPSCRITTNDLMCGQSSRAGAREPRGILALTGCTAAQPCAIHLR